MSLTPPMPSSPELQRLRFAGAAMFLAILYFVSVPAEPAYRLCPFHWLTGLPCPLCGLTRGLFEFAKGHFAAAERFNALTPLGFLMLFSWLWPASWRARLWNCGIAAFAVYGVFRGVYAAA